MKQSRFILAIGYALVLSACGGGGGGGGSGSASSSSSAQTSTLSAITTANSTKAAGNAYAGASVISGSSSSLSDVLTGVSVAPAGVSAVSPVLDLVRDALSKNRGAVLTGVSMSEACAGGGTMTIDATLKNTNAVSNGDTMAMTAKNCVENGNVMNGSLSITFSGISGDIFNSSTGTATLETRFTNFSVGSGNSADTLSGDMKIGLNATSATRLTLSITGASLQATEQSAGATVTTLTLTDYTLTGSTSGTTVSAAANFTIAGSSNGLGQFSYTVKSLQPFVSTGASVPASGSLIVNGAASSVTATVLNGGGVRLDYSAKGDGVITQTNSLSWAEFLAAR